MLYFKSYSNSYNVPFSSARRNVTWPRRGRGCERNGTLRTHTDDYYLRSFLGGLLLGRRRRTRDGLAAIRGTRSTLTSTVRLGGVVPNPWKESRLRAATSSP